MGLFQTDAFSAARNALLVEYDLQLTELIPENPFAGELRRAILSVLKHSVPGRIDEQQIVKMFDGQKRVVQLNLVAMGLNELSHYPKLSGEGWAPISNPFVIRNIEAKLPKAAREIERNHGIRIQLRDNRLQLLEWGLADPQSIASEMPSSKFLIELPDISSRGVGVEIHGHRFMYFENYRPLAETKFGIKVPFQYPQAVVVLDDNHHPCLLVRIEKSDMGTSMFCDVKRDGSRTNWGTSDVMNRDAFIRKSAALVFGAFPVS